MLNQSVDEIQDLSLTTSNLHFRTKSIIDLKSINIK